MPRVIPESGRISELRPLSAEGSGGNAGCVAAGGLGKVKADAMQSEQTSPGMLPPFERMARVMERVLDDISFEAPDKSGTEFKIDAAYVRKNVGEMAKNADLSRFIL